MAAINQDATIYRGGSYEIPISVVDENGDPLSLDDVDLYYRIAAGSWRPAVLMMDTADLSVDGSTITVPLTTEQTLRLRRSGYYHELYMVSAGERHVLMTGRMTVQSAQAALHEEGA